MFKLQIYENGIWRTVNAQFRSMLPTDCDVIAWLNQQYPGLQFRMIWKNE